MKRHTEPFLLAFHELRRRIAADPLYLGEPDQISLCYPTGSIAKRRMQSPPPNALPAGKGKWYAVSRGEEVGIFLDW